MKIYNEVILQWNDKTNRFDVVSEDSFEHDGPVLLAAMDNPVYFEDYDLNGDGESDWGSCLAKKRNGQAYYMMNSIAAPFIQSKGTGSGMFFDPENMNPLVNNEGYAKALEFW